MMEGRSAPRPGGEERAPSSGRAGQEASPMAEDKVPCVSALSSASTRRRNQAIVAFVGLASSGVWPGRS